MKKLLPYILLAACSACALDNVDQVVECTKDGEARFYPGEDGICVYQKCVDKTWTNDDSIVCGNVSCQKVGEKGEFACGECLNNSTEYQFVDTVCTKRKCEAGKWSEYFIEDDKFLCGQCEDGETRYYPNEIGICVKQKCENKNWKTEDGDACGLVSCNYIKLSSETENASDDRNGYYLCGECINNTNDYLLKDGQCYKRTCNNGKWGEQTNELRLELCVCKEGISTYINEDNICKKFDCISGNKEEDILFDCNNSCSGDACGECVNEDIRFVDIANKCMREVCMNGKWTKTDNFNCNYSCTDISKFDDKSPEELTFLSCGKCLNGSDYYRNDEHGFCKKYNCEKGELILSNEGFNCAAS